jgi:hypothetical protein
VHVRPARPPQVRVERHRQMVLRTGGSANEMLEAELPDGLDKFTLRNIE